MESAISNSFFLIILGFSMNSPFVHEIFYFGDDHFA